MNYILYLSSEEKQMKSFIFEQERENEARHKLSQKNLSTEKESFEKTFENHQLDLLDNQSQKDSHNEAQMNQIMKGFNQENKSQQAEKNKATTSKQQTSNYTDLNKTCNEPFQKTRDFHYRNVTDVRHISKLTEISKYCEGSSEYLVLRYLQFINQSLSYKVKASNANLKRLIQISLTPENIKSTLKEFQEFQKIFDDKQYFEDEEEQNIQKFNEIRRKTLEIITINYQKLLLGQCLSISIKNTKKFQKYREIFYLYLKNGVVKGQISLEEPKKIQGRNTEEKSKVIKTKKISKKKGKQKVENSSSPNHNDRGSRLSPQISSSTGLLNLGFSETDERCQLDKQVEEEIE